MAGDYSPTKGDMSNWSKSILNVFGDPEGKKCLYKFLNDRNIKPPSKCTHFQHFTIRPVTCNFKRIYVNADVHQHSFVLNCLHV